MKANFVRLKDILQAEFPGQWSAIHGANYPAPEWTKYAGQIMSAVQFFAMTLILFGDSLWTYVPGFSRGPPEFYHKMKENPALAFIILFLIIPTFVQSFANTGAFEVTMDGNVIFSKLETGRMPNVPEILRAVEQAGLKRGS